MTLPTVKAIKQKYHGPVDFATDFDYLDGALPAVLQGNPNIRNIIPYRNVTQHLYDAVLDLTCPCIVHEQPHAPPIHRIDLFARHAGIQLTDKKIDFYHTEEELTRAKEFLEERFLLGMRNFKLILVNPSSSTNRRDVPINVLPRLIKDLLLQNKDAKALVFTHYTDCLEARNVSWGDIAGVIQMKDYKIRDIAAFMHYCDMVVCPDTALLHIASALDKKTVAFFGPTDPRARINYHPKAVAIWTAQGLSCGPCWYSSCPSGLLCWKRLEYPVALNTMNSVLNNSVISPHSDIVRGGSLGKKDEFEVL
jgi:ADP-heptose:LPS heptosyltransferase